MPHSIKIPANTKEYVLSLGHTKKSRRSNSRVMKK